MPDHTPVWLCPVCGNRADDKEEPMGEDATSGLPADLASVLRDQSVIVPRDAAVFELIAAWAKAPAATASAEIDARRSDGADDAPSTMSVCRECGAPLVELDGKENE